LKAIQQQEFEQAIKREWERDASLREEFAEDFAMWLDPQPRPVLQLGRPSRSARTRASVQTVSKSATSGQCMARRLTAKNRNFHPTLVRLIAILDYD
jgi:hypothetical protein